MDLTDDELEKIKNKQQQSKTPEEKEIDKIIEEKQVVVLIKRS